MYNPHLKRILDLVLASAGLFVLAIPLVIVAIMIRRDSQGPAIFRQKRVGKNKREFVIYKFRTMTHSAGASNEETANKARVTRLGHFLRSSSIDELPQLVNVIKGEMSLVGPRPLLASYLPFYTERELKRFDALPGITGFAQIEGRHHASWDARLANDVSYVESISFLSDMKIIARTISCVLRQQDVIVAPPQNVAHLHIARALDLQPKVGSLITGKGAKEVVAFGRPSGFEPAPAVWAKQRRA